MIHFYLMPLNIESFYEVYIVNYIKMHRKNHPASSYVSNLRKLCLTDYFLIKKCKSFSDNPL